MLSEPETTVTWTEDEIDFGPGVVLDPAHPALVIYDDTHADEALASIRQDATAIALTRLSGTFPTWGVADSSLTLAADADRVDGC